MKRYEFRLAQVLRIRRAEHEQTEIVLTAANPRLRSLITEHDATAERCRAIDWQTTSLDPAGFATLQAASSLAASTLSHADAAVSLAAGDVALARIAWSNARQHVAALERLEAGRKSEWEIEQGRVQAHELDELAVAAFVRDLALHEPVR